MKFNNTITATSETTNNATNHRLDNMKDVRLLKGELYSDYGYIILSLKKSYHKFENEQIICHTLRQVGLDLIHLEVSTIESYCKLRIQTKMKLSIIAMRQRKHTFYMHLENYRCFLIISNNP